MNLGARIAEGGGDPAGAILRVHNDAPEPGTRLCSGNARGWVGLWATSWRPEGPRPSGYHIDKARWGTSHPR